MRLLIALLLLSFPLSATAQSPSPTPTDSSSDQIQKIRQAVQQKVQEKLSEINNTQSDPKKAFLGTVTIINPGQLTISYQNSTRQINYTEDTVIIDNKRNKTSADKIKVGQDILALGYLDAATFTFDAKRLVFVSLPALENPHRISLGKIADVSKSSPVLVFIPLADKNSQLQIKINDKTEILTLKNKSLKSDQLVRGQDAIIIFRPDPPGSKNFLATKIISLQDPPSPTPTVKP